MPTLEARGARPTFLVEDDVQPALAEGLQDLAIRETADGLATLSASFSNWGEVDGATGYLHADRRVLDFGKPIAVELAGASVFKGRIMALEGEYREGAPPSLTVLADDRLQDLRMTRRTRSFERHSDRDVFDVVARDHGLRARLDLTGPTWPVIAQLNQSDLAFLRERARLCGAELWVEDDTLHACGRADRGRAPLRLERGVHVREFRCLADLAHQSTCVVVSGWDPQAKRRVDHAAGDEALGAELGADRSGAALLRAARGERRQSIVHTLPLTDQEAESHARAAFCAAARRFVCGEGRAEPSPELQVGRRVELAGFGATFDGCYVLVEVCHRFDGVLGLRTEFRVERPGVGGAA